MIYNRYTRTLARAWGEWKKTIVPAAVVILLIAVALVPAGVLMYFFPPSLLTVPLMFGWVLLAGSAIVSLITAWGEEE